MEEFAVGEDKMNDARDVRKSKRGISHFGSCVVGGSGLVVFLRRFSRLLLDAIFFVFFSYFTVSCVTRQVFARP